MWTNYEKGVRDYCGHILPDGLIKNQKLDEIKLTPTTKDDIHDELISGIEVVSSGRMMQEEWDACADYSHKLFAFGQKKSLEKGIYYSIYYYNYFYVFYYLLVGIILHNVNRYVRLFFCYVFC